MGYIIWKEHTQSDDLKDGETWRWKVWLLVDGFPYMVTHCEWYHDIDEGNIELAVDDVALPSPIPFLLLSGGLQGWKGRDIDHLKAQFQVMDRWDGFSLEGNSRRNLHGEYTSLIKAWKALADLFDWLHAMDEEYEVD